MELSEVILRPVITEKTTALASEGKYTMLVEKSASKNQVKKALEKIYKVESVKINIIRQKPTKKVTPTRIGTIVKRKKGYKKAIVTLKKGQKISGFEVEK